MSVQDRWLLPDGIEELLPPEAASLEALRRRIVDTFQSWGYDLVVPPLIEYLESLLTGMGHDLDLQTVKVTDQLTGRLMGIRADMTPQVARIDAHRLQREAPNRLCYVGPVLHARPGGFDGSRNPLQVGAELYGHAGLDSDVEVLCLMLEVLGEAGVAPIHVDLGHVEIYRGLVAQAALDPDREGILFAALQRKARADLQQCLEEWQVPEAPASMLTDLIDLNGGTEVLDRAVRSLAGADPVVPAALQALRDIAGRVAQRVPGAQLHVDLAELRGYHYHTGVMFAAYTPGFGEALAWGGRYDGIGAVFGRARPATGFSTDLRLLSRVGTWTAGCAWDGIFAPSVEDAELWETVRHLRAQGERVIWELPGQHGDAAESGCDRRLERQGGRWVVVRL